MDSTNNAEVLDLNHHDHDHTHHVLTHDHNHDLAQHLNGFSASRYDGATRTRERQKLAGVLNGPSRVTPKKRARADSVLDNKQVSSSKKRKVTTPEGPTVKPSPEDSDSTDSSPSTNRKTSRRGFATRRPSSTPSTPPPSRRSRVQHKKDVRSALKVPRGPSRYATAVHEALRSSAEASPAFVIIDDDEYNSPPKRASAAPQQQVGIDKKSSQASDSSAGFAYEGFWEIGPEIALRSDDVFGARVLPSMVSTNIESGAVASTETYHDSDEDYFLPGDMLSQGSSIQAPVDTPLATNPTTQVPTQAQTAIKAPTQAPTQNTSLARPIVEFTLLGPPLHPTTSRAPILGQAAFKALQDGHAKESHDGLSQFPHALTHPATLAELQKALPAFPTILRALEQRMKGQFRDLREEHNVLAGRIDEVAAALGDT